MNKLTCAPILMFACVASLLAAPDWKIIDVGYPTDDVVIAGYNVLDFNADPRGRRDSTRAFQRALDAMGEAGGGTVFAPEGRYLFEGSLEIPTSVTLRGEWKEPTNSDPTVGGTILMPVGGEGDPDGLPFITVGLCAGVKDLNVWYPRQVLPDPIPYPWCLIQKGGNNATFENLTLVNPYQGIKIGPEWNELHIVRNVYGTPLKTGIWYDSTTDIGRLQTIVFSPYLWQRSGLSDVPSSFDWVRQNGTGIFMGRSDWEYVADVTVFGYNRGFHIAQGARGASNAQFYRLILGDCQIALEIEETNPYGMIFSQCSFEGIEQAVLINESFSSTVMFSNCLFRGREAIRALGRGKVLMEQSRIIAGDMHYRAGAVSLLNPEFTDTNSRVFLGPDVEGAVFSGNAPWSQIVSSEAGRSHTETSADSVDLIDFPSYPKAPRRSNFPARQDLLTVVSPSGSDDTQAIQEALDDVQNRGGGTVFLPAGDFQLHGTLTVPAGVELRGVHDVPHHSVGGGSVLHIYPSQAEGPTVILQARSGLRGLGFHYPTQNINAVQEFPHTIQGRGEDIYIINVNAVNPYKFIDFMTYRCDNHYIDYPSGAPLVSGIEIGAGSEDGLLMNLQFNTHYWSRLPRGNRLYENRVRGGIHGGDTGTLFWEFQKEHLDALAIGDTKRQLLFQNFVYGSFYGLRFTEQNGNGAEELISHGHGTDGSTIGVFFEEGHGTITLVNSELVAMSSTDETAILLSSDFDAEATLINTMVWGQPEVLATIDNGRLTIQNLHANQHGSGFLVNEGELHAYNLSFNNRRGGHLHVGPTGSAELSGVITNGPFRETGSNQSIQLVIERD